MESPTAAINKFAFETKDEVAEKYPINMSP